MLLSVAVACEQIAERFWPAEGYHQHYFGNNAHQPYCQYVVAPKVVKFRQKYAPKLKG